MMQDAVSIAAHEMGLCPPGVPKGARLVTLAQLRDEIAREDGSLRLGPRGSYLRCKMIIWPFGLFGTARAVHGGRRSSEHGDRVFSLSYSTGRRRPGNWKTVCFTAPGAAEREIWIWTLDDMGKGSR
jgi:hypothetical protein